MIVDKKPQFLGVDEVLRYDTLHTKDLLRQELEIRLGELENDWHYFSLEKIFFEEKVYKLLARDLATLLRGISWHKHSPTSSMPS